MRDQIASLRDGVQTSWLAPVQSDLEQLQKSASALEGTTVAERQQRFEAAATNIRSKARDIASRSNELGKSTAAEMRALAAAVAVAPGASGFSCYDPTLAQRLTQAADQADQPAVLKLREAVFNEGPAGVANAIKNLWSNIGRYLSSLGGYIASGGHVPERHTHGRRADLGPRRHRSARHHRRRPGAVGAGDPQPAGRAEPHAPRRRTAPDTSGRRHRHCARARRRPRVGAPALHLSSRACPTWSSPTSTSCDPANEDECRRALAMNQLAGVLDDLDLVRWPQKHWFSKGELDKLKSEEAGASDTDLTEIRQEW